MKSTPKDSIPTLKYVQLINQISIIAPLLLVVSLPLQMIRVHFQ